MQREFELGRYRDKGLSGLRGEQNVKLGIKGALPAALPEAQPPDSAKRRDPLNPWGRAPCFRTRRGLPAIEPLPRYRQSIVCWVSPEGLPGYRPSFVGHAAWVEPLEGPIRTLGN